MDADQPQEGTRNRALISRLSGYWAMEAMNVALVPVAVLICVTSLEGRVSASLIVSLIANCLLLAIGACYWRIVHLHLLGFPQPFGKYLPLLATLQPVALISVVISVVVFFADISAGSGGWGVTEWAMTGVTLLAVLEYVNYYHWQLQYFDHKPDFVALIKTRKLKRAHMARAIQKWKAGKKSR